MTRRPTKASIQKSLDNASKKFIEDQKKALELAHELISRIENYKTGNQVHWGHVGDMGHIVEQLEELKG